MPHTVVSFHAHPDDEVLLTGGTLARLAAEGHRVVLVVATDGDAGLAESALRDDGRLGQRRRAELAASAQALGVARVVWLGHRDSGFRDSARAGGFSDLPVDEAAAGLVAVLREEAADALTVYDPAGGYGHPDHVAVHHVGVRAAALAGTPVVLEATLDRGLLQRLVRLASWVPRLLPGVGPESFARSYTAAADITHVVDVRAQWRAKRAAMAAHASQAGADSGVRTLAVLLRLPGPLFRLVLGREWFVQRGRAPGPRSADLLDGVGGGGGPGAPVSGAPA
ncbi:PIG-L family deacetylase [Rhodococcus aerolatus]